MPPHITLLSIPISIVTRKQAVDLFLNAGKKPANPSSKALYFTATPNAEILLIAQKNQKLKAYLQQCSLNLPDTVSLLWAAECQAQQWGILRALCELLLLPLRKTSWTALPERVSGSDFFSDVCAEINKRNKKKPHDKIFLLGGVEGVAAKTKAVLEKKYKNIKIVGAMAGSPFESADAEVLSEIKKSAPDIIFVAYGCPKQELWIARNLARCAKGTVAMGIGGTFDFVVGNLKRAPQIFQRLGLEWVWRLLLQPRRARRIFQAVLVFPFVFLKNKCKN